MGAKDLLTGDQIATRGLTDWRPLLNTLRARFDTGDFVTGVELVTRVAEAAEAADHHPDVDLRYGWVGIVLTSHDVGGMTERDVALATRISELARELGLAAAPDRLSLVEWGLDTWAGAEVRGFWEAVLGLEEHPSGEVCDPDRVVPTLWWQDTEPHVTPRQRWHPDVWVSPELVPGRIERALAAGGTLVDDSEESFTVLADPQGNRVCLCTHLGRGG